MLKSVMKSFYYSHRSIRYRVPASSVCFCEGAWMVAAGQSSWGKGAAAEDEARRGRKTISRVVGGSWLVVGHRYPSRFVSHQPLTTNHQPQTGGRQCQS